MVLIELRRATSTLRTAFDRAEDDRGCGQWPVGAPAIRLHASYRQMAMTAFDGKRVQARLMTSGFAQAHDRFRAAHDEERVEDAFHSMFEALNWAHAVDDLIAKVWAPRGEAEGYDWRNDPALINHATLPDVVMGLRYARNRVHHHWADALVTDVGLQLPVRLPSSFGVWSWRSADDLPAPPDENREALLRAAYVRALQEQPVGDALEEIRPAFDFIGSLLTRPEPRRSLDVNAQPTVAIPQQQ